ncbi:hypothetical protein NMS_1328 [Nonlabens marinus S1-08]|uniref:Uncharacterized protein n=1 Tax=Nonlabens marinus S1-08 TaxID=1454201 RepID=W8VX55_9FLAO|nr:hypothetical protein NMS_1328 [Nonlabens marinus S1-08]
MAGSLSRKRTTWKALNASMHFLIFNFLTRSHAQRKSCTFIHIISQFIFL